MKIRPILLRGLLTLTLSMAVNASAVAHNAITINDGWTFAYAPDTLFSPVHLPHCWNSDAYHTYGYRRGTGVYKKTLHIPQAYDGKQIFLKFDGAANKSEVCIDGNKIGDHVGGYSAHILDITSYVHPGSTHELMVAVNNSDNRIPPYSADFTFMGGLYRDAWLIDAHPIHLDFYSETSRRIRTSTRVAPDGTCSVNVSGSIANATARKSSLTVDVSLLSPDGTRVTSKSTKVKLPEGQTSVPFHIVLDKLEDMKLWSPETPSLYDVEITVRDKKQKFDSATTAVGFRTFGFDGDGRFLLNGKPYKLRGMCRHQDQKPMGIALADEQHRRDMQLIKEMGANFIRISHYPQDDAIIEMCDRLGLIAWVEIPIIDFLPERDDFNDHCEIMLREMIRDNYNHPSIAMWGYMNEILLRMPQENREKTIERTRNLAHRLNKALFEEDSTRMTTMAYNSNDMYHSAGLTGITDIDGWNLYQGWYDGDLSGFEKFLSRQHRDRPDHRTIVSEYGSGSDLRLHSLSPRAFDFSMEYQQKFLEHYLPVIEDSVFIAGGSHWNFIDFSSVNRQESMPHINNKGLVTNDRRKKDVYYYYKAMWHDIASDTIAHIASRDWADRTEIVPQESFVTRPVKVYTNLPRIAMSANGRRLSPLTVHNCNATFEVPLTPGTNVLEVYNPDGSGKVLDAMTVTLSSIDARDGILHLGTAELAVNVGSNCYFRSDNSGLTWLPDRSYVSGGGYGHIGGKSIETQSVINLTDDTPLYQTAMAGLDGHRFDVLPGWYEVELSFAEQLAKSEQSAYLLGHDGGNNNCGWTDMNVRINGREVEKSFAPGALSGVKTMVKRRYIINASGSKDSEGIVVEFTPSAENYTTSLSAIKIRKL